MTKVVWRLIGIPDGYPDTPVLVEFLSLVIQELTPSRPLERLTVAQTFWVSRMFESWEWKCPNKMKETSCFNVCWLILDVYWFLGLFHKSKHIFTLHFPHNLQEFHRIGLLPVWWAQHFKGESLKFLQAPSAKAYNSRFSQLLDHDDVRFPSVGIPGLCQ